MKNMRLSMYVLPAILMLTGMGLIGCAPDVGLQLIASPEKIDFGADKEEMVLKVYKNYTKATMEPLIVAADKNWILPQQCVSAADDCVSNGPADAIRIPIKIDRNQLVLGLNVGVLQLTSGRSASVAVEVAVDETVQADFTAKQQQVSFGRPVEFKDLSMTAASVGAVEQWYWEFGDGEISTRTNPFHSYAKPGQYDVSLTITTSDGKTRKVSKLAFIRVNDVAAQVDFSASKTNVDINDEIVFTDLSNVENTPILSRSWAFGDGQSATALTPRHKYAAPGLYTVSLTISTSGGEFTASKENYIIVRSSEGPNANFVYDTGNRSTPYVGESIQFYDLSEPGSGAITSWAWDFGDTDPPVLVYERNPIHRYMEKGEYTVTLTVTTPYGVNSREGTVLVTYRPPVADFDAYPQRQFIGQPIQFFDQTEPGFKDIKAWLWQFGDGTTSTARNPEHSYARAGIYSVTLYVVGGDADSTEDTITKKDFITIVQPPAPDFTWSPKLVIRNQRTTFDASNTIEANEPIIRYTWNFGEGTIRQGQTVNHRFGAAGVYPVTLTVRTATNEVSIAKEVVVDQPPNASFTAEPRTGTAGITEILFTLGLQPENARPITRYFWEFGDNEISYNVRPQHVYSKPGKFTVRFTARYRHSQSEPNDADLSIATERVEYIEIQGLTAPSGAISADRPWAFTNDAVTFKIKASSPSAPITSYTWDFGDGTLRTLAGPDDVIHAYANPGQYAVKVTLEAASLQEPYRTYVAEISPPFSVLDGTDLDRFINKEDDCFHYTPHTVEEYRLGGLLAARAYKIDRMTSQCWNPDDAVADEYVEWIHPMVIVEPEFKMSDTAMLFIDGGSRNSTAAVEEIMWQIAIITGTTIVHVKNIPSQPIVFKDEIIPDGEEDNHTDQDIVLRRRSEDAIIAYSYARYIESYRANNGEPNKAWPALFPMAKAAVRAMDVAETVLEGQGVLLDGFIVSGASKRGWTTWLAGAMNRDLDSRIKGIAPIVINVLNMDEHLMHHRSAYGYWSPAIYDYAQEGVFDQLLPESANAGISPAAQSLLNCVDPYEYSLKGRYPMPKFMLNATGDEFFVPDTAELYFPDLEGEKHLCYVPNVGHGMGGMESGSITDPANAVGMLLGWYMTVSQEQELPQMQYSFESNGSIRVEVDTDPEKQPTAVRLWQATSPMGVRDFRNYIIGANWTSTALTAQSNGVYVAPPPLVPLGRYVAFFVQLQYPNSAQIHPTLRLFLESQGFTTPDITISTGVRVLPESYPAFTGYLANAEQLDAPVPFGADKLPVVVTYGAPREMGQHYGEVMAAAINAFIPAYINAYEAQTGRTRQDLMNDWAGDAALIDPRIVEEIEGIASGSGVSLQELQMAHAAAIRDNTTAFTSASTFVYKEMQSDYGSAHAITLNGPLARQLHQYQCAVVYIPNQCAPHTVFTHAGLAFGRTGINLGGISAVEIMEPPDAGTDSTPNAMPLMRSILYDAFNLRDGVSIMKQTPMERNTTLLLGDGRNEIRGALIKINPEGAVLFERYDLAQSDFSLPTRGILYAAKPDATAALHTQIINLFPSLSLTEMLGLANNTVIAESGRNMLNVLYMPEELTISFAAARANQEAYKDKYYSFNMQMLLP